jgi:hypothetical protein
VSNSQLGRIQSNNLQTSINMAPERGQSPPPEEQSGDQLNDTTTSRPHEATGKSDDSKKQSAETLKNLESNPKHILAEASKEKTSKN